MSNYYDELLEARELLECELDELHQAIIEAETEAEKEYYREIGDNLYKKLKQVYEEILEEENAAR